LLLRARRTGDIDRLLHGRRSAAAAAPQQKRKGLHIMAVQQRTYRSIAARPALSSSGAAAEKKRSAHHGSATADQPQNITCNK